MGDFGLKPNKNEKQTCQQNKALQGGMKTNIASWRTLQHHLTGLDFSIFFCLRSSWLKKLINRPPLMPWYIFPPTMLVTLTLHPCSCSGPHCLRPTLCGPLIKRFARPCVRPSSHELVPHKYTDQGSCVEGVHGSNMLQVFDTQPVPVALCESLFQSQFSIIYVDLFYW